MAEALAHDVHEESPPPKGAIADRKDAEEVCGRTLPEDLFTLKLWGRQVIVVRERPEAAVGSILLPETVQDKYPKSAGWVISTGPFVGFYEPGLKNLCPFGPAELLLKKVFFGRYAGIGLPVVDEHGRAIGASSEYGADFILMRDEDILANF